MSVVSDDTAFLAQTSICRQKQLIDLSQNLFGIVRGTGIVTTTTFVISSDDAPHCAPYAFHSQGMKSVVSVVLDYSPALSIPTLSFSDRWLSRSYKSPP